VAISVIVWVSLLFIPMPFVAKAVLALSLFPVLISELANSAIERVVDLATLEHHKLAKYAKDAGSAMVLFSVIFTILVWAASALHRSMIDRKESEQHHYHRGDLYHQHSVGRTFDK